MGTDLQSTFIKYLTSWKTLTDASVEDFRALATSNVRYRDPTMDSKGIDAVIAAMHKWFKDLDGIKFELGSFAIVDQVGFVYWVMSFRVRKLPKRLWHLEGVSKVTYDQDGKIVDQFDFWDALPLYESVPILGKFVTLIRRLFA